VGVDGVEKKPADCTTIEEIRAEIDRLDHAVIELIGKRFQYVVAASKFKTGTASVRAPERVTAMLRQRRTWAAEAGLKPDVIEKLFRDLVNHFIFIEDEIKKLRR
jgi:isochorismate pyruvate lyase